METKENRLLGFILRLLTNSRDKFHDKVTFEGEDLQVTLDGETVTVSVSGTPNINVSQYGGVATTLGQKAMAASVPVVLASDQSSIPVAATQSGAWSVTANAGTDLNTSLLALESTQTTLATQATLASILSGQLADGHNVTIDNAGGASAVNIQDGGNSITVDGTIAATQSGAWTVTANAGTNLNTSLLALEAGNLATIAGDTTSLDAKFALVAAALADTFVNPTVTSIGTFPHTFNGTTWDRQRGDTAGTYVQGDVAAGSAVSGNPVPIGLRDIAGQVEYAAGQDLGGGICVQYMFPVDGGLTGINYASDGSTPTVGNVLHDAVDTLGPVKIGGKASTSEPTAVANADRVDAYFDETGHLHTIVDDHTKVTSYASLNKTTTGNSTVITPTSGKKLRVKSWHVVNNDSATNIIRFRFTTGGTAHFKGELSSDGGARAMNLIGCNWEGAIDETLELHCTVAGNVDCTIGYEEI